MSFMKKNKDEYQPLLMIISVLFYLCVVAVGAVVVKLALGMY